MRAGVSKGEGGVKKKMTFNIDADLHRRLKTAAARACVPISVVLHNLIAKYVLGQEQTPIPKAKGRKS